MGFPSSGVVFLLIHFSTPLFLSLLRAIWSLATKWEGCLKTKDCADLPWTCWLCWTQWPLQSTPCRKKVWTWQWWPRQSLWLVHCRKLVEGGIPMWPDLQKAETLPGLYPEFNWLIRCRQNKWQGYICSEVRKTFANKHTISYQAKEK